MAILPVKCTYCTSAKVVKNGLSKTCLQPYQYKDCQKTFQLKFEKKAYQKGISEQIIDMSLNGSGTRDGASTIAE